MSTLTRWDPMRELDEIQSRLSSMFGRSPIKKDGERQETFRVAEWTPLVDITEDPKEYLIKAELPEIKKEDIKISAHHDVLVISGERKYEKEEKDKKYHRIERGYGSFSRSFSIPEDADPEKVTADFKDGVLQVHILKSEKAKSKNIEVKVN